MSSLRAAADESTWGLGLSSAQAEAALLRHGPNELQRPAPQGLWPLLKTVLSEPLFLLLVAAGLIYLALGSRTDALMLLGFVLVSLGITLAQARRTQGALLALRRLAAPQACVLRDGQRQRVAGVEVVPGDLLLLRDGDRVAADAQLVSAHDLLIDESLLTGESLPAPKASHASPTAPPTDAHVLAGTLVLAGSGWARVIDTGARTVMGRMGDALQTVDSPDSPLSLEIRGWVRRFTLIGLGLSAGLAVLQGVMQHDWLGGLLAGITLAMALLPQELLIILTVFMTMAAWRLAQQGVLVRQPQAVQALGAASVLCLDKTGTLTENRMAVVSWRAELGAPADQGPPDNAPARGLARSALLACETLRFDPMDHALAEWAASGAPPCQLDPALQLVHEYGLTPALPAMTHAWRSTDAGPTELAMKGAPEAVLALCPLDGTLRQQWLAHAQVLAQSGWRVLAVALAQHNGDQWPDTPEGFAWQVSGLLALADPLRADARPMVQTCLQAGLRVLLVTGDHGATASAVAAALGLPQPAEVVNGTDLAAKPEAEWTGLAASHSVFARIRPAQKLALIQVLQAMGAVVVMTGDGVNDASALKAAHIGMAMGGHGTEVAREASALVLTDDQLDGIVQALRAGRRLDDNLRQAMSFAVAVHVPIAGLALTPLLLGWPGLLAPVHIAFLEMVISPICAVVLEAEPLGPQAMTRPPRPANAVLLSGNLLRRSLLQGLVVWGVVATLYGWSLAQGNSPEVARSMGFTSLLACCGSLVLSHHRWQSADWRPHRALALVSGLALIAWMAMLGMERLRLHLGLGPIGGADLALCAAVAMAVWGVLVTVKTRFH